MSIDRSIAPGRRLPVPGAVRGDLMETTMGHYVHALAPGTDAATLVVAEFLAPLIDVPRR